MKRFIDFMRRITRINNYECFFQNLIANNTPVILAHVTCDEKELRKALEYLAVFGITPKYICIAKESEVNQLDNIPVIPIHLAEKLSGEIQNAFILPGYNAYGVKLAEYLQRFHIFTRALEDMCVIKNLTDFYMSHMENIYDTYLSLRDDGSRDVYVAALEGRICSSTLYNIYAPEPQYLLSDYRPKANDIVIDGGAFNGKTAIDFVDLGCDVYSFELDSKNYARTYPLAQKHNFVLENMGLSELKDTITYSCMGSAGSSLDNPGEDIGHVIDLDTYVIEKGLPRLDFIKMDIEGAEMAALKGASLSITKWKPKMAISTYHRIDDMWTIPAYIKSLRSDYEFSFRHYKADRRFDDDFQDFQDLVFHKYQLDSFVPTHAETVLYCR